MKKLHSKKLHKDHLLFIYSILTLAVLGFGIVASIYQANQKQDIRSKAEGIPLTVIPSNDCTVSTDEISINQKEQEMLTEINNYRQSKGLGVLIPSLLLNKAAAWMSHDMANHQVLDHTDSLGRSPDTRIKDCGDTFETTFGENISQGYADVLTTLKAWEDSPPHNINLLGADYKTIGIAYYADVNGGPYWTVNLGDFTGNPTLTPSPSSTPSGTIAPPTVDPAPGDLQIKISIKLPKIGADGNTSPKHTSRNVYLDLYDIRNTHIASASGILAYDGSNFFTGIFHVPGINSGTYSIKVKSAQTLQKILLPQLLKLSPNYITVVPPVQLITGDFNDDNRLNILDFNSFIQCVADTTCNDPSYDLNDDGILDIVDYNIMLSSFTNIKGD